MVSNEQRTSPAKSLSLGVIFLTIFIDLVGFSIIFPLFPAILEHYSQDGLLLALTHRLDQFATSLGMSESFSLVLFGGALGSLYAALQFVFSPIWGSLSDKRGRRPIILITTAGTFLSYLIWVFAGNFGLLVLARLIGGAMSGNLAVATAAVADVTTDENRAKGMGIVGVAFGLGFVIGPAIGGIAAMYNPLVNNPELVQWGINPFSLVALIAAVFSLVNFVWIRSRFQESLPKDEEIEQRTANPIARLLKTQTPAVQKTNFAYLVYILAFSGMEFTLTFLGVDRFSFGIGEITKMMIFIGFILILTQGGIVRRLSPKIGERKTATIGLALVAVGLVWLAFAPSVLHLYIGLFFMALGAGLCSPTLTALVSLYSDKSNQGNALGAFRAIGSLGRAVSPIIAGFVFWSLGSKMLYIVGAAMVLIATALCAKLPKPSKDANQ
ncbi:MFS transporter [Puniceicoccaceae bacterium K14]|nr:MFS transporter [Puniceicoccaceae bacterium K14]